MIDNIIDKRHIQKLKDELLHFDIAQITENINKFPYHKFSKFSIDDIMGFFIGDALRYGFTKIDGLCFSNLFSTFNNVQIILSSSIITYDKSDDIKNAIEWDFIDKNCDIFFQVVRVTEKVRTSSSHLTFVAFCRNKAYIFDPVGITDNSACSKEWIEVMRQKIELGGYDTTNFIMSACPQRHENGPTCAPWCFLGMFVMILKYASGLDVYLETDDFIHSFMNFSQETLSSILLREVIVKFALYIIHRLYGIEIIENLINYRKSTQIVSQNYFCKV